MRSGVSKVFLFLTSIIALLQSACDRTPKGVEGYIEVRDGKLYYQTFGKGLPIIVIHGSGMDQAYLIPQMIELAKDYTVTFYDQRGSGKSLETKMDRSHINIDQFVRDLEALRKKLGHEKVTLIGHSWGGFVAMQYAIAHPNHVSSMVLMASSPADYKGQKAYMDELIKRTHDISLEIAPLMSATELRKLPADKILDLYRLVLRPYFAVPEKVKDLHLNLTKASAVSSTMVITLMKKTSWMLPTVNLFPKLRQLKVPTLVIHGEQDVVPILTARKIQEAIPHAQGLFLESCGHFPDIEQPEKTFQGIRSFLESVSKR